LGHRRPPALVRDLDLEEDRSQIRTASGPLMAALPNLAITVLCLAGATNIAAALRCHAGRPAARCERSRTAK
jgi:hypothetical protein